ncbi:MAG: MerR family transcriptional regulator [Rhodospirillales bacterium]|nr:MerR family transcriptional regulator [Rhodospirillales bacterium]MDE0380722.1 MerR family transcriptional regulator [Rhodospirillales bacterium]
MQGVEPASAGTPKSPDAFRTIGEVSEALAVPQHVLRFWETKFPQIRPLKRGGGRRYYRPEDVALLRHIRHLLHAEGYTVRGVQKLLRERATRPAAVPEAPERIDVRGPLDAEARARASRVLDELCTLRDMLRGRDTA